MDIIEKAGAWFSYNATRGGQDRDNAKKYLQENPEICEEVEKKIKENYSLAFDKCLTEELDKVEEDDEA